MSGISFLLASASPARAKVLRGAGITPKIIVPNFDEESLVGKLLEQEPKPHELVLAVARGKAEAALQEILKDPTSVFTQGDSGKALLVACDSMLEIDGQMQGKPHTPELAFERIKAMQGRHGTLWTGHAAFSIPWGTAWRNQTKDSFAYTQGAEATTIHMGRMTDDEIHAYVATGEPLEVAGSFTIDGLGGAFIDSIDGDPHSVIGISLPLLRDMSEMLGIFWPDLWDINLPAVRTSHQKAPLDK